MAGCLSHTNIVNCMRLKSASKRESRHCLKDGALAPFLPPFVPLSLPPSLPPSLSGVLTHILLSLHFTDFYSPPAVAHRLTVSLSLYLALHIYTVST